MLEWKDQVCLQHQGALCLFCPVFNSFSFFDTSWESWSDPDGCFQFLAEVCESRDAEVVWRTVEKHAPSTSSWDRGLSEMGWKCWRISTSFSYRYSAPVVTKLNFVVPVHLCIALLVLGDFYSGLCQASNSWTSVSGASKKSSAGLLCMVPEDVSKPWIWEMWAEHRRQPKMSKVYGCRVWLLCF